jgi:hypothetical protein
MNAGLSLNVRSVDPMPEHEAKRRAPERPVLATNRRARPQAFLNSRMTQVRITAPITATMMV